MGPVCSFVSDLVFKNPEFSLPDICQWEVAPPSVEIGVKILTVVFGQVTSFLQVPIILSDNFIVGVGAQVPMVIWSPRVVLFGGWDMESVTPTN